MRGNAHMEKIKFTELGLLPEMQRAIDELGFEEATDIQAEAIPLIRTGADVIGRSQTGTGKTFAFAIPAIERIDREQAQPTPQVLILCPTRELAQQGCEEIRKLTRFMRNIWPADVYGGASMERQIALLRRANLVIGTPGRVMDHMRRGTLSLQDIRMVVLDEADEMLSMGFREDIETILHDVPESRQTVLFSATMPDAILELTNQFLREPKRIEINRAQVTLDNIRQLWMEIPLGRKPDALVLLLHAYAPKRCMIFVNTKLMADEVAAHLNQSGFTCEAIHGDMNQSQRTRVMEGFKSARLPILVATDVAARGIDVSDVDYVVNYDVPQNSEHYVHRIGRTGRAGHEGAAWSFCSEDEFEYLCDIQKLTGLTIPTEGPVPEYALRKAAPARKPAQKAAQRPARTQEPKPARNAGAKSAQRPARDADAGQQPAQRPARNTEQKAARNAAKTPQSAQNPAQPEAGATSRPSRPRRRRGTRPAPGTPIEPAGKTASRPADATRGQAPKQGSGNAAKAAGNKSAATAAPKNAPNPAPAPSAKPSRRRKRGGSGNAAGSAAAAAAIAAPAATAEALQKKWWKRWL